MAPQREICSCFWLVGKSSTEGLTVLWVSLSSDMVGGVPHISSFPLHDCVFGSNLFNHMADGSSFKSSPEHDMLQRQVNVWLTQEPKSNKAWEEEKPNAMKKFSHGVSIPVL
ncbi:hypothetical protein CFP56_008138 [Quercus suber]|uniref:Uncharacterized protein n=1 Tax=Quercus suber TaxID=58331 RepID=A0AAW0L4X4_QUESU|nr:hypothetical protein CFP56_69806 [Quercus suber]